MTWVQPASKKALSKIRRTLSSQSDLSFFQKAWMGWKHLSGQIAPTQREKEELHELRLAMLSIQYGRHMRDDGGALPEEDLQKIWKENEKLGTTGMRYEVQVELAPDILELFEIFDSVDRQVDSVNKLDVLVQDYEDTLRQENQHPDKSAFFSTKRGALEILIQHFGHNVSTTKRRMPWEDTANGEAEWHELLDEFGYNGKEASNEVYNAIREEQTKNVVRSFLIKQHLGFSVLALKSRIPGAGRGIFVDGIAPPGSIVGFFPGQVWPREYFLNPSPEMASYLAWENNPNFQLHSRGDDFMLDCRASPYTVLQNPWAVAHIANHAPITQSNVRSVGINIFEKMQVGSHLKKYIPNEYAKPPTLYGGSFLDRDPIEMHSMCLLAKRERVSFEEVMFDYRLHWVPEEMPAWYKKVDYKLSGIDEQREQ